MVVCLGSDVALVVRIVISARAARKRRLWASPTIAVSRALRRASLAAATARCISGINDVQRGRGRSWRVSPIRKRQLAARCDRRRWLASALSSAAPLKQRSSPESPSSSWSQLARSSAAVEVARHGADVVAVNVSLARGGVGPPRAARRRRLALRSRRGCARRGRAVRATVVARVAVVVVIAARAVECGCGSGAP